MTRLAIGFIIGGIISWVVAADVYLGLIRYDLTTGIMCRVHGLETAISYEGETLCVSGQILGAATPEQELWDFFWFRRNKERSYPQ